jgi:hypothetical protein
MAGFSVGELVLAKPPPYEKESQSEFEGIYDGILFSDSLTH